ncbi:MAG: hypothetical protein ACK40L_00825 [Hydrogenophaga sp.]
MSGFQVGFLLGAMSVQGVNQKANQNGNPQAGFDIEDLVARMMQQVIQTLDINQDGKIDNTDLQLASMLMQATQNLGGGLQNLDSGYSSPPPPTPAGGAGGSGLGSMLGDINGDGVVDLQDLMALLTGTGAGGANMAPGGYGGGTAPGGYGGGTAPGGYGGGMPPGGYGGGMPPGGYGGGMPPGGYGGGVPPGGFGGLNGISDPHMRSSVAESTQMTMDTLNTNRALTDLNKYASTQMALMKLETDLNDAMNNFIKGIGSSVKAASQ